MAGGLALGALAVTAAALLLGQRLPSGGFAADACERLQAVGERVVGQELALGQAAHAICDHLQDPAPERPLVLAAHGPPGVGKSFFHRVAAGALYGVETEAAGGRGGWSCPGAGCPGYVVLFGMDYLADEHERQAAAIKESLERHLRTYPEAFVVVEEYDKLDCRARGFFRQLLDSGFGPGAARAVVLLESNAGYLDLHGLVAGPGRARDALRPEEAQRTLKNVVFERYSAEACEARADTLKLVGLVHAYLPFLPLEAGHLRRVLARALPERLGQFHGAREGVTHRLEEGPAGEGLLDFLAEKAEFDGGFALEGAKEAGTILSRYVTPQYRRFLRAEGWGRGGGRAGGGGRSPPAVVRVGLAEDGSGARFSAQAGEGGGGGEGGRAGDL